MRVIRPPEYRIVPWKNGGGVTTEIFASPPAGNFDWRVSIATVKEDGPFSIFIGYERHIMTLAGEGMRLEVEGRGRFDLEPFKPFSFSGDLRVSGSLLNGPVLDFNLMVRRDFGRGALGVQDCNAGHWLGSGQSLHLVHVLKGECEIGGELVRPNDRFYLAAGEWVSLSSALKLAVCEIIPHGQPWPSV
jgi:environmental stress-induced protein Ves